MLSVDKYVRNKIIQVHPVSDGKYRCKLGSARHLRIQDECPNFTMFSMIRRTAAMKTDFREISNCLEIPFFSSDVRSSFFSSKTRFAFPNSTLICPIIDLFRKEGNLITANLKDYVIHCVLKLCVTLIQNWNSIGLLGWSSYFVIVITIMIIIITASSY